MQSDSNLERDVLDELKSNASTSEAEIRVAAREDGVVLSGVVDTYAQKYAVERVVERVLGVRPVADDVRVRTVAGERTDEAIEHAARDALQWDSEVPHERLDVVVEDGWVTLQGSVDWLYQRTAAERGVRELDGVRGVTNRIQVAGFVERRRRPRSSDDAPDEHRGSRG